MRASYQPDLTVEEVEAWLKRAGHRPERPFGGGDYWLMVLGPAYPTAARR